VRPPTGYFPGWSPVCGLLTVLDFLQLFWASKSSKLPPTILSSTFTDRTTQEHLEFSLRAPTGRAASSFLAFRRTPVWLLFLQDRCSIDLSQHPTVLFSRKASLKLQHPHPPPPPLTLCLSARRDSDGTLSSFTRLPFQEDFWSGNNNVF